MNLKKYFNVKKLFKEDDGRFYISCGFKLATVFIFIILFMAHHLWVSLSMNMLFFEAVGSLGSKTLESIFFDHCLAVFFEQLPMIFLFIIALFFTGMYIGKVLLRPFAIIGEYCEGNMETKQHFYNPDLFSDYRLLARFSELFFKYIEECRKDKKIRDNTIPLYYSKIHKPLFEKVFFFHFLIIVFIIASISTLFFAYLLTGIETRIINLSLDTIKENKEVAAYFLNNQAHIYQSLLWSSAAFIFVCYFSLSFHFYNKVSGAVFAFFSTMRAIMKGNKDARVHLIGYNQIRPYGRMFNKFMDLTFKEIESDNTDTKN